MPLPPPQPGRSGPWCHDGLCEGLTSSGHWRARSGWALSEAYREEIRKLRALPSDLPAPALLWTLENDIARLRWVILCFEYVDGTPPRRPWQPDELRPVIEASARLAPLVAEAPDGLDLPLFAEGFPQPEAWSRYCSRPPDMAWMPMRSS
jgi:hypothetical protein